jgi:hypothetical protein
VVPMLASTPSWPAEADYLLFASRAWTPLVNGYGRRTPAIYQAIADTVAGAPHAARRRAAWGHASWCCRATSRHARGVPPGRRECRPRTAGRE